MFQSLIETRVEAAPRSYGSFGVAFGLHAMLFAVVITGSYLVVGKIASPDVDTTLTIVTLPPPVGGHGGVAAPPQRRKDPAVERPKPAEPTQPVAIPETPVEAPSRIVDTPVATIGDPGNGTDGPGGPGPGNGFGPGEGPGPGSGIGPGEGVPSGTGDPGPIFVDATVAKPELLVRVQPRYPETMRRARIPGTVILQAVISTSGGVESVEVLSSTNPLFNAAAMEAVRQWRYRPAMQNGRPVTVFFTVEVRFILQ